MNPLCWLPRKIADFAASAVAVTILLLLSLPPAPAGGVTVFKSDGLTPNFSKKQREAQGALREAYDAYVEARFTEAFAKASEAAAAGDPEAWDFVGWLHESGRGTRTDLGAANYAYAKAQEGGMMTAAFRRCGLLLRGNVDDRQRAKSILEALSEGAPGIAGIAGMMLGEAYVQGLIDGKPDFDSALEWWTRAAEAGAPEAYLRLARLRGGDYGFPERADPAAATAALLQASNLGNAQAMAALGARYLMGPEALRDPAKGVSWLEQAETKGVPDASLFLGRYHAHRQSFSQAREHYEAAVAAGSSPAHTELGLLFLEGLGGEPSEEKALELFKTAAAQGQAAGAHHAASLMLQSRADRGDTVALMTAYRFLLGAAEAGRPEAQTDLGLLYLSGRLGVADPISAVAWLDRAARAGLPAAQFNLGVLFELGEGVNRNLTAAANLFSRASEAGHPAATTALGRCHARGHGVEQDLARAWALFSLAADRADPDGARLLAELAEQMTPDQLEEGRQLLSGLKTSSPETPATPAPGAVPGTTEPDQR